MKRMCAIGAPLVMALCLLVSACTGVRPLHKGDTVRCPSCGIEYPAGAHHECPLEKKK